MRAAIAWAAAVAVWAWVASIAGIGAPTAAVPKGEAEVAREVEAVRQWRRRWCS